MFRIRRTQEFLAQPVTRREWRVFIICTIVGFLILTASCLMAIKIASDTSAHNTAANKQAICNSNWKTYNGRLGLRATFAGLIATIPNEDFKNTLSSVVDKQLPPYPAPICVKTG